MSQALVAKGSITDISKSGDMALAILNAKAVLLCDRSGSMAEEARGGKASYEIEDEIVTRLQARYQGQVVLVAFHSTAFICPDGILPPPQGDTNMLDAFRVALPLHEAGLRVILISDGQPSHDETEVIESAKQFKGNLDTIFVGPETSPGASFLKRLAKAVKGSHLVCDIKKDPALLEKSLTHLLLTAGAK